MSCTDTEALLEVSCESTRDLYLLMLGIVSPITKIAQDRINSVSKKINKTEEDKNLNTKFADNQLATFLDNDVDFKKLFDKTFVKTNKFSWANYDIILKKILDSAMTKSYFTKYMQSPEQSLAEDCKLFTKIFEEEIADRDDVALLLESMSIYWNDDLAYALTICCHTFADIAAGKQWNLPPLYHSDILRAKGKHADSDKVFVTNLLRAAYNAYDSYSERISNSVTGWEKDRMVMTDVCIIVTGLAEMVSIPDIPLKVTINEYVEIAKYYGSPKSPTFVNGLLDKLSKDFKEEGLITKE